MSEKCFFFGYTDIGYEEIEKENCAKACQTTEGCTHFDWNNGYCVKKSGFVTKNEAIWASWNQNTICGIIEKQNRPGKISKIKKID